MRGDRILIVDDHPIVRAGLRQVLEAHGLAVCADVGNAHEVLDAVRQHHPSLVILDLALKDANGINLARDLRLEFKDLAILILSIHEEALYAARAIQAGANGFLSKSSPPEEILSAVDTVLAGNTYLSRAAGKSARRSGEQKDVAPRLTNRELQVLDLLGQGLAPRHIAAELNLSVSTIEVYRERLKSKLDLENAAALSRYAVSWAREQERGR